MKNLFLFLSLLMASHAGAQSVDSLISGLDTVRIDFNGGNDSLCKVLVQPDGKILVCGHSDHRMALARLNRDGTLDGTFGQGGKVIVPRRQDYDYLWDMILQSDGKILAAATTDTLYHDHMTSGYLIRFMPDGSVDSAFGINGMSGMASTPTVSHTFRSIALQPDGKILVTHLRDTIGVHAVWTIDRYLADGTPDMTYHSTDSIAMESMLRLSDGRIMTILGSMALSQLNYCRLDAAGQPDPTFRREHVTFFSQRFYPYLDGSLIALSNVCLTRLDSTGRIDSSWGINGNSSDPFHFGHLTDAVVLADGSLLCVSDHNYNGISRGVLRHYDNQGRIDSSFGASSVMYLGDTMLWTRYHSMAISPSGHVVVGGTYRPWVSHVDWDMVVYMVKDHSSGIATTYDIHAAISPNPAKQSVTVSASENISTIAIYDMLGQMCLTVPAIHSPKAIVDVSHLAPGAYSIVVSAAGSTESSKLTIVR